MKPIRVLVLTERLVPGGQERFYVRLARHIDPRRFQLIIGYVERGPLLAVYKDLDVTCVKYAETTDIFSRLLGGRIPMINVLEFGRTVKNVVRIGREYAVDILLTNGLFSHFVGATTSRITGIPSVRFVGNVMQDVEPTYHRYFNVLPFGDWTSRYLVFTDVQEQEIRDLGVDDSKIFRGGCYGVDLSRFHPSVSGQSVRRQFGIQEETTIVGQAGRIVQTKRFDFMLEVARYVVEREPTVKFMIVGEGPEREFLEQYANRLDLQKDVIFTGLRDDMPMVTAAFDVAMFTMKEAFGGTANWEALASGVPVVSSLGPQRLQSEVIDDQVTGMLVPWNNREAFGEAVLKLVRDSEMRTRMGRNARRASEERFDFVAHSLPQVEQLFTELSCRESDVSRE